MPLTDAEAVLDALSMAIIAFKNGEAVWMNAEARRCGAHDPHNLGAIRRALSEHPARITFEGRAYALAELDGADAGTIVVLVPLTLIARLDPGAGEGWRLSEDFHEIFRNSFDGIFVSDGEGRTLMVNAGCERNYDLASGDMVGKHVSEFEAKGLIRPVIAIKVIETRERVTAVQRTHKGKTIMATGIPLFDEAGRVRRVIINSRDTTELTQLQEELARIQDDLARAEFEVAQLRRDSFKLDGIVLQSEAMQRTVGLALRVAKADATVLLTGESGVGKDVLARLIHTASPRAKAPFIKINCGAIPRELLESELFGYEGGAFTGAQSKGKPGLIELADGGTLFLDEIGELPLEMQVKLLHILQDRTVARVGATRSIRIDIRILAATNRDLEQLVEAKAFRSDLFYRLNVVPVEIPPLRERRQDILPLLQQTLKTFNTQYGTNRSFSRTAVTRLTGYDWPGNVRELRNIVERLVVTAMEDTIGLHDLPARLAGGRADLPGDVTLEARLISYEQTLIEEALQRFGSTRAAARHLGVSQSTIVRKLRRAGTTRQKPAERSWN